MLLHSIGGGGRKWCRCRTRSGLRICPHQPQGCSAGGRGVGAPKDSGCSRGLWRGPWQQLGGGPRCVSETPTTQVFSPEGGLGGPPPPCFSPFAPPPRWPPPPAVPPSST